MRAKQGPKVKLWALTTRKMVFQKGGCLFVSKTLEQAQAPPLKKKKCLVWLKAIGFPLHPAQKGSGVPPKSTRSHTGFHPSSFSTTCSSGRFSSSQAFGSGLVFLWSWSHLAGLQIKGKPKGSQLCSIRFCICFRFGWVLTETRKISKGSQPVSFFFVGVCVLCKKTHPWMDKIGLRTT